MLSQDTMGRNNYQIIIINRENLFIDLLHCNVYAKMMIVDADFEEEIF